MTDQPATAPLTEQQLADIEARTNAATPGPWGVYESGYVIELAADLEDTGHGYSARRGIARLDEEPLDNDPTHREWTAEEDWTQVQADGAFIAHAREDVDVLVAEVRRLQASVAELERIATPRTPRICECGHGHLAHTVPAPHSCFAYGRTCDCPTYQQMPHDKAVAYQKQKQAERRLATAAGVEAPGSQQ